MIITRGLLVRFSDGFPPSISSSSHPLHSAYKRLFRVLAVTDKFCSFELLEQWLDDEKRNHLNLPLLLAHRTVSSARLGRENVTIPKEERLRLLNEIGAFDVPIGKKEKALRKSHFFFRTTEQVFEYGSSLKSRRDMKEFEEMKAKGPSYDTSPIDAQKEASNSSPTLSTTVYHINNYAIDADKEIGFFLQRGAIVSASIGEQNKLQSCGQGRKYFGDGRPFTLCRISGCFTNHQAAKNHYFCRRHYPMIEGYTACDAIASKNSSKEISQDDTLMTSNATMTKAAMNLNPCYFALMLKKINSFPMPNPFSNASDKQSPGHNFF